MRSESHVRKYCLAQLQQALKDTSSTVDALPSDPQARRRGWLAYAESLLKLLVSTWHDGYQHGVADTLSSQKTITK